MNNNQMTPAWVVENFLPEYEERWVEYIRKDRPFGNDKTITSMAESYCENFPGIYAHFCHKHFREALIELLKAQREECAEAAKTKTNKESTSIVVDKDSVLNAPIPEPKNR